MTQAQLAELAELAVESVSRLETGRLKNISLDVTERLASALKVPLATLFEAPVAAHRGGPRPVEKRLLVMLSRLSDEELDDVYQGLRRLLGVRARARLTKTQLRTGMRSKAKRRR